MSGRDPTDEECDDLGWEILSLGRPESCRGVIRHFAREWQARALEELADREMSLPLGIGDFLRANAARIREGRG